MVLLHYAKNNFGFEIVTYHWGEGGAVILGVHNATDGTDTLGFF
jgi:hypothetical protein